MEAMQLLAFTIQGRLKITGPVSTDFAKTAITPRLSTPSGMPSREEEIARCVELNVRVDDIAKDIEQELRTILPLASGISAQAEVSFRPGSIILEGSLILLSWAGRTALEPIRDELGNLIKTITKRVMARALEGCGVAIEDLAASPLPSTPTEEPPPTPVAAPIAASQLPRRIAEQPWLVVLIGLLTVLVLIVLCDLLFVQADVRRPMYVQAAPVAEAPRPAPAAPLPAPAPAAKP